MGYGAGENGIRGRPTIRRVERGGMSMQSGTVAERSPWAAPRHKGGMAVSSIIPPMRIPPSLYHPASHAPPSATSRILGAESSRGA